MALDEALIVPPELHGIPAVKKLLKKQTKETKTNAKDNTDGN